VHTSYVPVYHTTYVARAADDESDTPVYHTQTPVYHSQTSVVRAYSARTSTYSGSSSYHSSYSGGYSIPSSIVQCESGGNWNAVNPSSGAGGAYQILPSTWQAYGGTGSPQNASPAEQSAIAAKIYASSGAGAWVCK
jgi:muramidase (phage lysozyme)